MRFGHLKMALAEHDAALKFYEKTYGVRVEKPLPPWEKPEVTPEMRSYFASLGRKGGRSKSPTKIAAVTRNAKIARARATCAQG
jgi:hypothetical protein